MIMVQNSEKKLQELTSMVDIYEKNTIRLEELLYKYQQKEAVIKDSSTHKVYNRRLELVEEGEDQKWSQLPELNFDLSRHENTILDTLTLTYWDRSVTIEVKNLFFSPNYLCVIDPIWWESDIDEECPIAAVLKNSDNQYNIISGYKLNMENWWNHVLSFYRRTGWARDNSRFENYKKVSFWFKDEIEAIKWLKSSFKNEDTIIHNRYIH